MKKIFIPIIVVIMTFSLIGCGDKTKTIDETKTIDKTKTMDEKYKNAEGIVAEPPIYIENTPITFISENNIVTATFANNTDKNITSYKVTTLIKSTGKKAYFQCDEKVDSKKNSPKIESFNSTATNTDDIEILKYAVGFTDEKGLDRIVEYNCKTKKYILI